MRQFYRADVLIDGSSKDIVIQADTDNEALANLIDVLGYNFRHNHVGNFASMWKRDENRGYHFIFEYLIGAVDLIDTYCHIINILSNKSRSGSSSSTQ